MYPFFGQEFGYRDPRGGLKYELSSNKQEISLQMLSWTSDIVSSKIYMHGTIEIRINMESYDPEIRPINF